MKIGQVEILDHHYELHATDGGRFVIYNEGEGELHERILGSGETLDAAREEAKRNIRKNRVKLQVRFITRGGEHGVVTGVHARNRTLLVRLDDQPHQIPRHRLEHELRPDIPQEALDRILAIGEEMSKLTEERMELFREHTFNVAAEVDRQLGKEGA